MASLAASILASLTPTPTPARGWRSGDRADVKSSIPLLPIPVTCPKKRSSRSVIAMAGVAKFKGTHMREKHLTEMIEKKVAEATEVCEGDERSDECKVAWDEVEEVSQAKAHLRAKLEKSDPLEAFCSDNPETDECRVYEH